MDIGKKISQLRKLKGWNQAELAEKLNIHKSHLCRWELGQIKPRLDGIEKLAEIFEISPMELGSSDELAVASSSSQLARQIESLPTEDQEVVKRVVEAMLTKQRMRQAIGA